MTVGSRVFHKRYKWQVGTITGLGYRPDVVYVLWESFWGDPSQEEYVNDLRTTPIQPEVFA